MNDFQRLTAELESRRCPTCRGLGHCDDADLGDISFNTWTCTECDGSGLKHSKLMPGPMAVIPKGGDKIAIDSEGLGAICGMRLLPLGDVAIQLGNGDEFIVRCGERQKKLESGTLVEYWVERRT